MAVSTLLAGAPQRLGLAAAVAAAVIDQGVKLWLLYGFGLPGRGRVPLAPLVDLVLAWNTGISYGLFQQAGPLGQWALFALKAIAVLLLGLWLVRTGSAPAGGGPRRAVGGGGGGGACGAR